MATWFDLLNTCRPKLEDRARAADGDTGSNRSRVGDAVVRLMTPGPLAAMHTLGFCRRRL